ncbi:hypothetical protein [Larkinella soli]|uniref:hypothetical protein n=1 Tax=Larkinella soli TaxID=1770527 RepID=UPI000FFC5B93|nr:hypothetical protein [Larkinella soli]
MKMDLSKQGRTLLTAFCFSLSVVCMSCGGKQEGSQESGGASAEAGSDTSVMGIQGDTTTNDLDGPVAAPGDTATGQTLPEMRAKKKE